MRSWSIHAGQIFGIDLRIHVSFLFLLLFVWMTDSAEIGADAVGRGVALTFLVLASVLLHELGHRLAAMHQNRRARPVLLMPIGGVPIQEEPDREPPRTRDEVRVPLAGPVINIFLAFVAAAILLGIAPESSLWQRPLVFAGNLPRSFVWVIVFLGGIIFFPSYPWAGGRVARAVLARRRAPGRAPRRAVSIGQGFALAL